MHTDALIVYKGIPAEPDGAVEKPFFLCRLLNSTCANFSRRTRPDEGHPEKIAQDGGKSSQAETTAPRAAATGGNEAIFASFA